MNISEPKYRCPTKAAIDRLAKIFGLPNTPEMQDWEWEVADYNRISEFVNEYKKSTLSDDERFTLLEIIIQSFEDSNTKLSENQLWHDVLSLIQQNYELHAHTIWYWSVFDNVDEEDDIWRVTPFMRKLYAANV